MMKTYQLAVETDGCRTTARIGVVEYAVLHNGEPVAYAIGVLARYLSLDRRDLVRRVRQAASTSTRAAVNVSSIARARPWSRLRKDGTQSRRPRRNR